MRPVLFGLRSLLGVAFAAGLFVGCFKDSGGNDEGASETGGCSEGTSGCVCYGNGTCDAGLECSENVCVPEGCDEGSLDCNCYGNGTCDAGLECMDGVCKPGGPGDETDTGTTTTDGTDTSSSSSDETGPFETGDPTVSSSVTTLPTTGPDDCNNLGDCEFCIQCTGEFECSDPWAQCDFECQDYIFCVLGCWGDEDCWGDCKGSFPGGVGIGDEVLACNCEPCADSCLDMLTPVCG